MNTCRTFLESHGPGLGLEVGWWSIHNFLLENDIL